MTRFMRQKIAVTGSCGKTTVRELIAAILETKWKVLKTNGNRNLPGHTKKNAQTFESDPSYQAVILEMGMGKLGAGIRHCRYFKPNISVITNIGTAHYGNLGNSIRATAASKSALIQNMDPKGTLFINRDDKHSRLLSIKSFTGTVITIGMKRRADYRAQDVTYTNKGMTFQVMLDEKLEKFFIPAFGIHNVYNALFAIAIAHKNKFTAAEIRAGLQAYKIPEQRLNVYSYTKKSILIDDTVNANPQSMKAAIDVLVELGKKKKKKVVLGSMLELGEFTEKGHKEIGKYLAEKKVDMIYLLGDETRWIRKGAVDSGFPTERIQHYTDRDALHVALINQFERKSAILVKGSCLTDMKQTVNFLLDQSNNVNINPTKTSLNEDYIYVNSKTRLKESLLSDTVTMHFGQMTKEFKLKIDDKLRTGEVRFPHKLTDRVTIPDLQFDYYFEGRDLYIGPVIGIHAKDVYHLHPEKQLLRFTRYADIKGLVFLFKIRRIDKINGTIKGLYYCPKTNSFVKGVFPYPSAIFNRASMPSDIYQHLKERIGDNIFNYPYGHVDKYLFWDEMSKRSEVKNLPDTMTYNAENLDQMLRKHSDVYLKPTTLAGGKGVLRIVALKKSFLLYNTNGQVFQTVSKDILLKKIEETRLTEKNYIIQQSIPFYNRHGNKVDFRVYFQRDKTKNWRYSGMEAKIAKEGSIISNSKKRKKIIPGEEALRRIYHLNKHQTKQKIQEISMICIGLLQKFNQYWGHIGDTAIDLIIDKQGKVWILEVQLDYASEIKAKRDEDERFILPNILPTPIEYAKSLTGF